MIQPNDLVHLEPIVGPAAWRGVQLGGIAALTRHLEEAQRAELVHATEFALRRAAVGAAPTLGEADFPLQRCLPLLAELREDISRGRGAALLAGLPALSGKAAEALVWGIGCHLGVPEPQDAAGALLHHVRDMGVQVTGTDDIRGFQTNAALDFHNDGGEAFLLHCLQQVPRGGDSLLVSAVAVYNELLRRRPDLVRVLAQPIDFDARAQQQTGEQRLQRAPIFVRDGKDFCALYKRGYIQLGQRFPEARPLTLAQTEAMDALDEICRNPTFHVRFRLQQNQMLLASNFTMLHARLRYDDEPCAPRYLLRLWLTLHNGARVPDAYARTREFGRTWRRQQASSGALSAAAD